MSFAEAVVILLAGMAAGTINTIVGSGSLITFPTLVFFGYPPLTANISNNIGLVPGGLTGSWGYRREVAALRPLLLRLAPASLLGGLTGALLLLVLPATVFDMVVPVLVGIGLVLVIVGPGLQRRAAKAHPQQQTPARAAILPVSVFLAGVYGGYFGAAQGVIMMGLMSLLMTENLQALTGLKNFLVLIVNTVAAAIFIIVRGSAIDWRAAALIGLGSLAGGVIGASVGRRLPAALLRAIIIAVGVAAILRLTIFA